MKLLLVGLDGTRIDVALGEAPPTGNSDGHVPGSEDAAVHAPTLAGLAADGLRYDVEMTVPTDSGPGWASLLTGTAHAEHGVADNSFTGHRLGEHPDILARIRAHDPRARTLAAATWTPLIDPAGPGPVIRAGERHSSITPSSEAARAGSRAGDEEITEAVVAILAGSAGGDEAGETGDLTGIFVHLDGVDEAGHAHGAASPEYRAAIGRADAQLSRLVEAARTRSVRSGEQWLVAVLTNHGHTDAGGHGGPEADVRRSFLVVDAVGVPGRDDSGSDLAGTGVPASGFSRSGHAGAGAMGTLQAPEVLHVIERLVREGPLS